MWLASTGSAVNGAGSVLGRAVGGVPSPAIELDHRLHCPPRSVGVLGAKVPGEWDPGRDRFRPDAVGECWSCPRHESPHRCTGSPMSCWSTGAPSMCARSGPTTARRWSPSTRRLSEDTVYSRFFSAKPRLSAAEVERFTHVDHDARVAFVGRAGRPDRRRRPLRPDGPRARGRGGVRGRRRAPGAGHRHRAARAPGRGGTGAGDHPVRGRDAARQPPDARGVPGRGVRRERTRYDDGVVHVELAIEPTDRARAAIEAARAPGRGPLGGAPADPAVGRGDRRQPQAGHRRPPGAAQPPGRRLRRARLPGEPRGRPRRQRQGLPDACWTFPTPVDLAVVAVPAAAVLDVVDQCGRKGVAGLVVLTAGFGEVAGGGSRRRPRCATWRTATACGWSGPTASASSTPPSVSTPRSRRTRPSRAASAMQSQSGALGIAVLERSARIGLGRVELRLGRQQGRRQRQRPAAVLGGRPRNRRRAAVPRVVRQPPQVQPHRPAGLAPQADRRGQERPLDRRRPGRLLAHRRDGQPRRGGRRTLPPGRRDPGRHARRAVRHGTGARVPAAAHGRPVAIVGNSGGPGILATDACDGVGLDRSGADARDPGGCCAKWSTPTARWPTRSTSSPRPPPTIYEQALRLMLADERVDAAIVICTPTFAARPAGVADVLCRVQLPIRTSRCSDASWPHRRSRRCWEWTRRARRCPPSRRPSPPPAPWPAPPPTPSGGAGRRGPFPSSTASIPTAPMRSSRRFLTEASDGGWLPAERVDELLDAAGIPLVRAVSVASAEQAGQAAADGRVPGGAQGGGPGPRAQERRRRRAARPPQPDRRRGRLPRHGVAPRRADDRGGRPADGATGRRDHRGRGPGPVVRAARDVRPRRGGHRAARRPRLSHPSPHRPRRRRPGPLPAGLSPAVRLPRLGTGRRGRPRADPPAGCPPRRTGCRDRASSTSTRSSSRTPAQSPSIAGSESHLCLPGRLPTPDEWTDRSEPLEVGRCRPGS